MTTVTLGSSLILESHRALPVMLVSVCKHLPDGGEPPSSPCHARKCVRASQSWGRHSALSVMLGSAWELLTDGGEHWALPVILRSTCELLPDGGEPHSSPCHASKRVQISSGWWRATQFSLSCYEPLASILLMVKSHTALPIIPGRPHMLPTKPDVHQVLCATVI